MKEDIKVKEHAVSKEEIEEMAREGSADKNMALLEEFLNLNQIPPDQVLTMLANGLIYICEQYFNKKIFLAVIDSMKKGWDKDRE